MSAPMSTDNRVIAKQVKTSSERLDSLEQLLQAVINGTNTALNQLNQKVSETITKTHAVGALVNALVELAGQEAVDAKVLEHSRKAAEQQAAQEKAEIQMLVAEGRLTKAEVVGDKSVITGAEKSSTGEVKHPGYARAELSRLTPEVQSLLKGKKVGDSVPLPNDVGSFEIAEIFDIVEKVPAQEQ